MNNLTIVIIDDEKKLRELLKTYIDKIFPNHKHEIILCNSVSSGVEAIENYLPDLVFLDIEMPEENGFELFKKVNKETFEVVFTTAYAQYMEQSINEIGCFGYLLKPFDKEKLKTIFERFDLKATDKKYFKFINTSKNKRMLVHLDDILYCKADNNYSTLYLKDNQYLLSKTLRDIENRLPTEIFSRVHRSFIVNMLHVDFFDKDKNGLVLKHEIFETEGFIPVSASHKEKIDKMFL